MRLRLGETVSVFGANGAGKSSLVRTIAGLIRPTVGRVVRSGLNGAERLGLVGHQTMLYGELSVRENLEFFARMHAMPNPLGIAKRVMERVEVAERASDAVRTLSRGLQQRVAIGRAILHAPRVLLLDEPFAGLDERSAGVVESVLDEFRRSGAGIVITGHNVEHGLAMAERAIVMAGGRTALDCAAGEASAETVRAMMGGRG